MIKRILCMGLSVSMIFSGLFSGLCVEAAECVREENICISEEREWEELISASEERQRSKLPESVIIRER